MKNQPPKKSPTPTPLGNMKQWEQAWHATKGWKN